MNLKTILLFLLFPVLLGVDYLCPTQLDIDFTVITGEEFEKKTQCKAIAQRFCARYLSALTNKNAGDKCYIPSSHEKKGNTRCAAAQRLYSLAQTTKLLRMSVTNMSDHDQTITINEALDTVFPQECYEVVTDDVFEDYERVIKIPFYSHFLRWFVLAAILCTTSISSLYLKNTCLQSALFFGGSSFCSWLAVLYTKKWAARRHDLSAIKRLCKTHVISLADTSFKVHDVDEIITLKPGQGMLSCCFIKKVMDGSP